MEKQGDRRQRPEEHDLRIVFWETTSRCNQSCRHCRMAPQANEGGPTARATVVPENGQTLVNLGGGGEGGSALAELTTQEAMRFIDELSADFSPLLILSGGEPLCRPDIFEIASYAAGKGLAVALATNATLVTDDVAGKIKGSGIRRVSVSLDGPNAGVHDGFRGLPGSFDAAIAGLKQIQGVGVSTQINTTVTCHNVDFLPETLELALDFGVDAFHIFCLVPVGCGLEIADEEQISPQRYEEVLRWLFEKSLEVEIHLKATCAPHYYRIVKQLGRSGNRVAQERQGSSEEVGASPASEEGERGPEMRRSGTDRGMSAVTKGCLAGQAVCFISHTGEVFPCGYLPLSSGNIRHQRLSEIWGTSPIFESLRDPSLLKGKCGICEYRLICQGCRARAYGCTGDFLAEEPYCTYQPRSGD